MDHEANILVFKLDARRKTWLKCSYLRCAFGFESAFSSRNPTLDSHSLRKIALLSSGAKLGWQKRER